MGYRYRATAPLVVGDSYYAEGAVVESDKPLDRASLQPMEEPKKPAEPVKRGR